MTAVGFTESVVELAVLDWFEELGYGVVHGPDISPSGIVPERERYPDSTLADLYDPLTMPPELTKAHQALDRAVDRLYREQPFPSDKERLELLFELYQRLASS